MALFHECMRWCAYIVRDFADIVRDGDFATVILSLPSCRVDWGSEQLQIGVSRKVSLLFASTCLICALLVKSSGAPKRSVWRSVIDNRSRVMGKSAPLAAFPRPGPWLDQSEQSKENV
jgi:hypothetical protein